MIQTFLGEKSFSENNQNNPNNKPQIQRESNRKKRRTSRNSKPEIQTELRRKKLKKFEQLTHHPKRIEGKEETNHLKSYEKKERQEKKMKDDPRRSFTRVWLDSPERFV